MTDIGWRCPVCKEWNAHSVKKCLNCKGIQLVPKARQQATKITGMLSLSEYRALSPNKVSTEEYTRYCVLYRFQDKGIIQNLELQVKYEVQPRIVIDPARDWYKGFTQSRQTYSPDFRYRYDGIVIVEEYKGVSYRKSASGQKLYPRIEAASRKSIKLLISNNKIFQNGQALFVISGWYAPHGIYYAFNANSRLFEYPLANYILEDIAS